MFVDSHEPFAHVDALSAASAPGFVCRIASSAF